MTHLPALFFLFAFCTSCEGQNKKVVPTENSRAETKDVSTPRWIHSKYEYTDAAGARLIIENGLPRGNRYTDPNGEVYGYAIFWTRIINETDNPLELNIDFPVNSFESPWLPGKYHQVLVPPDTMSIDKEPLYNYGLTNLTSILDTSIHKPSSLKRTIHAKESSGFYVVLLSRVNEAAPGALRTGVSLKEQHLYYKISVVNGPQATSLVSEKEIECGRISLTGLMRQE